MELAKAVTLGSSISGTREPKVLIRTDPQHADMLNEQFHVMELDRDLPDGSQVYKLRKWDDHSKLILAHSTALIKASDFVVSNFVKLDASEKEMVAQNTFKISPSLALERQPPANVPALVTTPRTYPSPKTACNGCRTTTTTSTGTWGTYWHRSTISTKPRPLHSQSQRYSGWHARAEVGPPRHYSRNSESWYRPDRVKVWRHEPDFSNVHETTDIYKFSQTQSGVYRTIFVCVDCKFKCRSPSGTGSTPLGGGRWHMTRPHRAKSKAMTREEQYIELPCPSTGLGDEMDGYSHALLFNGLPHKEP